MPYASYGMPFFGPTDAVPAMVTQKCPIFHICKIFKMEYYGLPVGIVPFHLMFMGSFGPVCLLCAFTDCIYKTLFVLFRSNLKYGCN